MPRRSRTPAHRRRRSPGPRHAVSKEHPRLLSLDVFRGATMAAMVIVNNPGDWGHVYPPLLHAEWDGWTPTDLIFPSFLFIVGVSVTLSRRSERWPAIVRRGAIIIAVGLFLAGVPYFDASTWRIPGVLQRIGVCYLAAAGAYHATTGDRRRRGAILMSAAVFLLLAYWLVLTHVPVPGGLAGDLSPDGNLAAYIDRTVMPGHLWKSSWDPEGLLSTVPAIATTLFGVAPGLCLGSGYSGGKKGAQLAAAGAGAIVGALMWSVVFPINKSLWTSSYAVFTAGAASLLLAACYWIVDVKGWRGWTMPFVILGSNAVTLYVASELLAKVMEIATVREADGSSIPVGRYIYLHYFPPLGSPRNASLLYAMANLLIMLGLLALLYRRRIFLRV